MLRRHWGGAALSVSGSLQDLQTSSSTTVRCVANCDSVFIVVIVRGPLLAGRHLVFIFLSHFSSYQSDTPVYLSDDDNRSNSNYFVVLSFTIFVSKSSLPVDWSNVLQTAQSNQLRGSRIFSPRLMKGHWFIDI